MNKKRITAFLLMLAMLITSFSVTYAENAEETTPVQETPVELLDSDEFHALYTMGLLGEEMVNADKKTYITRAQFTGWLFKLSGYPLTEFTASEMPFRDVSVVSPYCNEICTMYQLGIVNGTDPDMFSPDAHVTYAQACKLIIDVLGYRQYAEIKYGEYPEGYVMMAGELEINDGVKDVKWNTELTAENAVTMLYNAGLAEVFAFSGVDKNGNPTYETDGTTLFEKGNNIYIAKGTLQSDGESSVVGEEIMDGIAIIDGVHYTAADADLSRLVGCKVTYYYRDDEVSKKLLWATLDKNFTNMLELKAEDLVAASPEYSLTNIVYYEENGDIESAKVNPMADVIYNNSRCGVPKVADIKPISGEIRLIDNNDDEIYDVVIVKEYQNLYVKQTSTDGHHIIGKNSKTIDLDTYDTVKIMKDGEEIEPLLIGSDVVISYVENKAKTKIYIYVSSEKIKAKLNSLRASRGRALYNIDGKEYRLSNTYAKLLEDTNVYAITPVIGREYTYYFDITGEIAEIQETTANMQYALLMSARPGEPYEDCEAYVRLLLPDNSKVTGEITKKFTVNGKKMTGAEFLADPHLINEYNEFNVQVVKVLFNNEGILTKLDFANDIRNATDPVSGEELYPYGYDSENFSLDHSDTGSSIREQDSYIMCKTRYMITPETVVFVKWEDSEESEPYEVKTLYAMSTGTYYKALYDITEDMSVSAVYREGLSAGSSWISESSMLVDEIDYVYENDQEVKRVSGYLGNKYTQIPESKPGVFPDDLKRGDFIRIAHQDRKAVNIVKEMKAEDFLDRTPRVIKTTGSSSYDDKRSTCFVPLYSTSPYCLTIFTPSEWQASCGRIMSVGRSLGHRISVVVYDLANDEMHIGDMNDVLQIYSPNKNGELPGIYDDTMVYLRTTWMSVVEILLVRY